MVRFTAAMLLLATRVSTLAAGGQPELPDFIQPVSPFSLTAYLGTWYEIARLDHWFERGLQRVTASYSLNKDGSVRVVNRGKNQGGISESIGRAQLAGSPDQGFLKVSFFGPFYAAYVIFELGENYDYAFVGGGDHNYLWLLSRTPQVSPELKERFVKKASQHGYPVDELIWLDHS